MNEVTLEAEELYITCCKQGSNHVVLSLSLSLSPSLSLSFSLSLSHTHRENVRHTVWGGAHTYMHKHTHRVYSSVLLVFNVNLIQASATWEQGQQSKCPLQIGMLASLWRIFFVND